MSVELRYITQAAYKRGIDCPVKKKKACHMLCRAHIHSLTVNLLASNIRGDNIWVLHNCAPPYTLSCVPLYCLQCIILV